MELEGGRREATKSALRPVTPLGVIFFIPHSIHVCPVQRFIRALSEHLDLTHPGPWAVPRAEETVSAHPAQSGPACIQGTGEGVRGPSTDTGRGPGTPKATLCLGPLCSIEPSWLRLSSRGCLCFSPCPHAPPYRSFVQSVYSWKAVNQILSPSHNLAWSF